MLYYIIELQQLNKKWINSKIDADTLLALKLLYNANLTEHQRQLALTKCPQMKYEKCSTMILNYCQNRTADK